nr:hypothetical protein Iba_scaffold15190CG0010 [Ipomoea batatas]
MLSILFSISSKTSRLQVLSCWYSHATLPLCTNFETSDHLDGLGFETATDKKRRTDWKIEVLTALASLSALITDEMSRCTSKGVDPSISSSIFFIAAIDFLASLFIFFMNEVYLVMLASESKLKLVVARISPRLAYILADWKVWR